VLNKISPPLRAVLQSTTKAGSPSSLSNCLVQVNDSNEVQVYVGVEGPADSRIQGLVSAGMRVEICNTELGVIQGWLPRNAVETVAALPFVRKVSHPSYPRLRAGSVMTEGDAILGSNLARALGATGGGIKIGAISDGVEHRSTSQATGDLPPTFTIDPTYPGRGDEGTALLEIAHDVAPAAPLAFSGPSTSLGFIAGLNYLVNTAKCKVVFDAIGFYDEPYFEDGPVAQAVATQASKVVYISACGNDAQTHYQATYSDRNPGGSGWPNHFHQFAAGDWAMRVQIPAGGQAAVFLQWSDPFGGSANDYDLFMYNDDLTSALAWSNGYQTGHEDPYEAFVYNNKTGATLEANLLVNRESGAARVLEIFTWGITYLEYITPGDSVFGHPSVPGVLSVGAIGAREPGNDHAESYSSRGPVTLYVPTYRQRGAPRVVAIDGVSVTGAGGFSKTFYGTSAAAAHAAGISALILSKNPAMTPAQVVRQLETTALDLGATGFDPIYGWGRVRAGSAIRYSNALRWQLFP
jgi:subtilisin family serine protease